MGTREPDVAEGSAVTAARRRLSEAIARDDARGAGDAIDAWDTARAAAGADYRLERWLDELDGVVELLESRPSLEGALAVALFHRASDRRSAGRSAESSADVERLSDLAFSDGVSPNRRGGMVIELAYAAAKSADDGEWDRATALARRSLDVLAHPDLADHSLSRLAYRAAEASALVGRFDEARRLWRRARDLAQLPKTRGEVLKSVRYLVSIVVKKHQALAKPASALLFHTWDWHRNGPHVDSRPIWNRAAAVLAELRSLRPAAMIWIAALSDGGRDDSTLESILSHGGALARGDTPLLALDLVRALDERDDDADIDIGAVTSCIRMTALHSLGDIDGAVDALGEATSALRMMAPGRRLCALLAYELLCVAIILQSADAIVRASAALADELSLPTFPADLANVARMVLAERSVVDTSAITASRLSRTAQDLQQALDRAGRSAAARAAVLQDLAAVLAATIGELDSDDGESAEPRGRTDANDLELVWSALQHNADLLEPDDSLTSTYIRHVEHGCRLWTGYLLWAFDLRTDGWWTDLLKTHLASMDELVTWSLNSDDPRAASMLSMVVMYVDLVQDFGAEIPELTRSIGEMTAISTVPVALKLDARAARSAQLRNRDSLLSSADSSWEAAFMHAMRRGDHRTVTEIIAVRRSSLVLSAPKPLPREQQDHPRPLAEIGHRLLSEFDAAEEESESPPDMARAASPLVLRTVDPKIPVAPRAYVRLPDGSISLAHALAHLDSDLVRRWLSPWIVPLA